jgi:uncharacterized integral membrane protein
VSEQGREATEQAEARRERVAAEESRRDRALRYGHRGSLYASLILGIAAAVLLILLIARNTRRVRVDYLFGDARAGLIWLIIISAITGWVLGIVTAFLIRRRTRWDRQR